MIMISAAINTAGSESESKWQGGYYVEREIHKAQTKQSNETSPLDRQISDYTNKKHRQDTARPEHTGQIIDLASRAQARQSV